MTLTPSDTYTQTPHPEVTSISPPSPPVPPQDGQAYLEELVKDMVSWLSSSSGLKPERSLQSNGLLTTLSQHYFLFLGSLSSHPQGVKLLEKCSLFQW